MFYEFSEHSDENPFHFMNTFIEMVYYWKYIGLQFYWPTYMETQTTSRIINRNVP